MIKTKTKTKDLSEILNLISSGKTSQDLSEAAAIKRVYDMWKESHDQLFAYREQLLEKIERLNKALLLESHSPSVSDFNAAALELMAVGENFSLVEAGISSPITILDCRYQISQTLNSYRERLRLLNEQINYFV